MNQKPISDLRRRMLEDMAVRRLGEKTQHDYIKHVETFAIFLGRSPDTATAEDLRRFQVHETGKASSCSAVFWSRVETRQYAKSTVFLPFCHSSLTGHYGFQFFSAGCPRDFDVVARLDI
jgi:Phage integrase, N-terminal SAM-like domain